MTEGQRRKPAHAEKYELAFLGTGDQEDNRKSNHRVYVINIRTTEFRAGGKVRIINTQ